MCSRTFISLLFTAIVLLLCSCSHDQGWIQTSRELHKLAGPGAIDCGYIRLGADKRSALNCAKSATSEDQPYIVAIEVQGKDTVQIIAVASVPDDQSFLLKYDHKGWDPNELKPGTQLLGKLLVYSCASKPSLGPEGYITCQ